MRPIPDIVAPWDRGRVHVFGMWPSLHIKEQGAAEGVHMAAIFLYFVLSISKTVARLRSFLVVTASSHKTVSVE